MSVFKKLSKADVTTVKYTANKQWNLTYNTTPNDSYTIAYQGIKTPYNINDSTTTNGYHQSSIFASINHLFYQSYSGSLLNTGSLRMVNDANVYSSASQQRPTGSYFNYNTSPYLIKNFPTASGATIQVLNINKDIYGSKVLPYSFQILSSIQIVDDGFGNLFDVTGNGYYIVKDYFDDIDYISGSYFVDNVESLTHVGNIFYAQGIVVITNSNPTYQTLFNCNNVDLIADPDNDTTFTWVDCTNNPQSDTISAGESYVGECINTSYLITYDQPGASYTINNFCNDSVNISFKNEHIIYENEIRCTVKESEYNLSYNPSLTDINGLLYGFATGSAFHPYITTIGLYNDDNDLLMVAKLSEPIMSSLNTDMTFVVKYDT
jgi:hypothetical protein